MGIVLLMKMGWKPGDEIGEKIEKKVNRIKLPSASKPKMYGCARRPDDTTFLSVASDSDSDSESGSEIYRELGKKAPQFVRKDDSMGLGYVGLDRNSLGYGKKKTDLITIRDQFNKTIKISGQVCDKSILIIDVCITLSSFASSVFIYFCLCLLF